MASLDLLEGDNLEVFYNVIKSVGDLWRIGGFSWGYKCTLVFTTNETDHLEIHVSEILLTVALKNPLDRCPLIYIEMNIVISMDKCTCHMSFVKYHSKFAKSSLIVDFRS